MRGVNRGSLWATLSWAFQKGGDKGIRQRSLEHQGEVSVTAPNLGALRRCHVAACAYGDKKGTQDRNLDMPTLMG